MGFSGGLWSLCCSVVAQLLWWRYLNLLQSISVWLRITEIYCLKIKVRFMKSWKTSYSFVRNKHQLSKIDLSLIWMQPQVKSLCSAVFKQIFQSRNDKSSSKQYVPVKYFILRELASLQWFLNKKLVISPSLIKKKHHLFLDFQQGCKLFFSCARWKCI